MPFHFCMDELLAIAAALPFVGYGFARLRGWIAARRQRALCGHDACKVHKS